jgi:hypothetical protein
LFIRDFKKLRLVLASVGIVTLLYMVFNLGLIALARWAEVYHNSYPWKHEDYLRCLLPTLFENRGPTRILLAGPSEVREGLICEQFDEEFPSLHAFQSAQSLGTFDDLLLMLDYVEKAYGPAAMPRILVLGITPRFVANIPQNSSPLAVAINRYSPFYSVKQTSQGSYLIPKNKWEGFVSRARFLLKQQPRYLAALSTLLSRFLEDDLPYEAFICVFPGRRAFRSTLTLQSLHDLFPALNYVRDVGVGTTVGRWLRLYTSPYKYHHLVPLRPEVVYEWLHEPESFWLKVYVWDPVADAQMVRLQFARLLRFTGKHGIQLYVVNLPERDCNRNGYQPGYYAHYLTLVHLSLDDTPFLNLRDMLEPEEFYDVGHPTLSGAVRVTDRVIGFIKNNGREHHR